MLRHLLIMSLLLALTVSLSPSASADDSMGPHLKARLLDAGDDTLIPVIIVMKDRPDLAALESAGRSKAKPEKRRAVCDLLKAHAAASQAGIRNYLEEKEMAAGGKFLWINNTIAVWVTPAVAGEIAGRADVGSISLNIPRRAFIAPPESAPAAIAAPPSKGTRDIAWGVTWIEADKVWSTYNIRGRGVTVAVVDSGSDYFHSDLNRNIWINPGENLDNDLEVWDSDDMNGKDDDNNGYVDDLIGYDFGYSDNNPMDDNGHGTHTAGTVGGDGTAGTQTGVAPGVKLMICKVGIYVTSTDEASVWEGMQYAADNGADLITMSLGWWHDWYPRRVDWRLTCQYVKAAGTALVVAAGNERGYYWIQAPHNIRTPGDCPEVICAGATGYQNNNYASFSSYGPTVWDEGIFHDYPYPPGLIKPEMSAPGENVNSTTWGGGYSGDSWSGTSMATPHIAGVCALMLEANPALTPDDVQQILESTAMDLGAAGKDNDYGYGQTQAVDAVEAALNFSPGLAVTVTPYNTVVPKGSTLDFDILIQNLDSSPVSTEGWIDVDIYGAPYAGNPLRGPKAFSLPANGQITKFQSLLVTPSAPVGNIYELFVRVGAHPLTVKAEDSFTFEVTP